MKPQELRIGNVTDKGIVFMIRMEKGIWGCDIIENEFDSSPGKWFPCSKLNPIVLDESWIIQNLQFQTFRHSGDDYYEIFLNEHQYLVIYFHRIHIAGCYLTYGRESIQGFNIPLWRIQYVHKLQNLHYDFTDEELIMKKIHQTNETHN